MPNNHFSTTNLAATDVVLDTPTSNFCTWNPISGPPRTSSTVVAEGNLKVTGQYNSSAQYYPRFMGTMAASSGKWFYELRKNGATSGWYEEAGFKGINTTWPVGSHGLAGGSTAGQWVSEGEIAWNANDGGIRVSHSGTALATGVGGGFSADGDIIGLALDLDASPRTLKFFKNGSATTSTTASVDLPTGGPDAFHPALDCTNTILSTTTANFGQDATFAGTESGTTYTTDASGGDTGGEFTMQPPAGYKAWTTKNLPEPTIAKPSEHFNTLTYASSGAKTGVGFQPDLVWVKARGNTYDHELTDSVRGVTKALSSNATNVESTDSTGLTAFGTDGFTVGAGTNYATSSMVAWSWKESATAGMDIVTWTGNDSGGFSPAPQSVSHSLTVTPELIIAKPRTANGMGAGGWVVWTKDLTSGKYLIMNTTAGEASWSDALVSSIGSSSVTFGSDTMGNGEDLNADSFGGADTYVAYLFASVEGYSKVGSYSGNSLAAGPFVYCGFRPAYILIKNKTGSFGWFVWDTARNTLQPITNYLYADTSAAEATDSAYKIDVVSNGFRPVAESSGLNNSAYNYIYYAVAESPLKYASAR